MTTAATLALYGLPALRYMKSEDPEELTFLALLAQRALELAEERDRRLGTHIANAFVKAKLYAH